MSKSGGKVKESPEEIELARIADERWTDYKTRFVPIENIAIQDTVDSLDNPSEFGPAMANLGAQSEFSALEGQAASGLTMRGAGPAGSGAFMETIKGLNTDRVVSSGQGQANSLGLQRTQGIGNMQSLINMGQGQANTALSGLGDVASQAQRQSFLDAQASAASRAAIGGAVGTGAGMVAGNYDFGGGE